MSSQKKIVILGAGGFAREVYWHLYDRYIRSQDFHALEVVFVDDISDEQLLKINDKHFPIVKNWVFPKDFSEFIVGIGAPEGKEILVNKALAAGLVPHPTVIHPKALLQDYGITPGFGGVICPGCILTTNIKIGNYVILNLNVTIGHDSNISDFVTINPGCSISGDVIIGNKAILGSGTIVREKIRIADQTIIGAQSCVVKHVIDAGMTLAGVPAKPLS